MVVVDVLQDVLHTHRVQPGGGFVQNEHGGLHGDDARDGHPALLAAGELEGGLLQHLVLQAHKLGGLPYPAIDLPRVQPHIPGAEGDVLVYRLLKQLVLRVLEDQPHLEAGLPGALLGFPDVAPFKQDPAGGGLQQAVEVLDEGGFARAGVADDAQVLSAVGGEVHVHQGAPFERGTGRVDMTELFRLNDRFQMASFLYQLVHPPQGNARAGRPAGRPGPYCSSRYSAWAHSSSESASRGTSTPAWRSCHKSSVVSGTVRPTDLRASTCRKT